MEQLPAPTNAHAAKRSRSPGYPSFSLPEAIRKAEMLYRHDKRNPVPLSVAAEHWGYSPTSSAVLLSVATLKKFGLLEEAGSGTSRLVKLTDLALHILLSTEGSAEWQAAVKGAALSPPIHAELWQQYGEEVPSDTNLKRILILERGFGDAAAKDLIREYRETISFARVTAEHKMVPEDNLQVQEEDRRMPVIAPSPTPKSAEPRDDKSAGLRRYAFPLDEQPDVELYLPVPMTEENYTMLKAVMDSFLTMSKPALVAKKRNQAAVEGESAD